MASVASPFTLPASGLTLTLTANSTVADGAYTLAFQATSGTLSSTASVSLNVQSLASFSFNLLFSSLVTTQGGSVSGTFDMSLGSGNTNFSVSLNVTGLSPGLTATFSPNPLPVTTGQPTVTLTATSSAQLIQNATAQLVATRQSDGARASATFTFTVAPPLGGLPNNRTTFVRTDDTPLSAVYDPTHKLVFAALPGLNRVDAISPATAQVVKSISVPLPQYLDLAPDDSQVIVGTNTNLIFFISTSTLQIVRETFLPKYTPVNGFPQFITPSNPLALPGGDVLINGGSAGVFRWNPATDALTVTQDPGDLGPQWVWTRSLDGTTVLISNYALPGILLLYDPNSNSFGAKAQFNDAPFALAANPNGTRYVAAVGAGGTVIDGIFVLDANLKTVGMLPVGGQIYGIRYSLDGGSIYVVAQEGGAGSVPIIFTISSATLQVVGAAPAYASSIAYFTIAPQQFKVEVPLAVDETGLIIGAADHGMVFDDSTYFQNLSASTPYSSYTIIVDPAEGPAGVSTPVTIKTDTYPSVPDIWFGDQIGSNLSLSGGGQPQATAPPLSAIGPVNVKLIQPSGQVSYIPQGFTYGEIALSPVTLAAGPAGGVTADLFGYGFSVDSTAPNLAVTISNQAAAITSQTLFPAETPYPFPLQHLKVTVPSGSPGAQNITINSSSGTATIPGGFHFARSVTDYPSPVQFHAVLYDKQRQQLYLSSQGRVDVFSLNSSVYLAPIVPPTLTGNLQLWGMALTPDLSRLLVANYADESVAIINPDQPSSAQAVAVGMGPYTIATTNTNQAFIAPANTVQFLKLDLSTLQVSPVSLPPGSLPTSEGFVTSSSDGSKVFLAPYGGSALVGDTQTGTWQIGPTVEASGGASAGDGNLFVAMIASPFVVDANAAYVSSGTVPDYLPAPIQVAAGVGMHESGSLVYVAYQMDNAARSGIDIYDAHHGNLRERLLLSEALPYNVSGLSVLSIAIDEIGGRIFLVTTAGLTIINLDAVPLSLGSVTPNSGMPGAGLSLRGSGFTAGTTAAFNGTSAAVTFVDADTLQTVVPGSFASGPVSITLSNPDGSTYTLDDAFNIN